MLALAACDTSQECETKAKHMGIDNVTCMTANGRVEVRNAFQKFTREKVTSKLEDTGDSSDDCERYRDKIAILQRTIVKMTDIQIEMNRRIELLEEEVPGSSHRPTTPKPIKKPRGWRE